MAALNPVEFDLQDMFGSLVDSGGTARLMSEIDSSLPTLYADRENATPVGNPATIAAGQTKVRFYAPSGRYRLDVTTAEGTATRRDMQLGTARGVDISVGTVTLAVSATSTTVAASGVVAGALVFLSPASQNAATAGATTDRPWVAAADVTDGQFIIRHSSLATADRTFNWLAIS